MTKRRDFLKKAAMAPIVFSPLNRLPGGGTNSGRIDTNSKKDTSRETVALPANEWEIAFIESTSFLELKNDSVFLSGKISFSSEGEEWKISSSRDGVPWRYAIIDKKDNVQGYFVITPIGNILEFLFYHRTAQNYSGKFSFEGTIRFAVDAFPCCTYPIPEERVLHLFSGKSDSLLMDSLFSPASDTALRINAHTKKISTIEDGTFCFSIAGSIEEPSEATFTLQLENDYFKKRYVPYYAPIDRTRCRKVPTGWMSWNTYFDKASAEDNLQEARLGKKYLQPFGCEFWSIESWQGNSDQLPVSRFYNMDLEVNQNQFPEGMKKLADDIRALGFRPGLWTAPFGTGNEQFYKAHKEWFLHDKDGKPISSWNGRYTLDPTVKEARNHLREIHRIASREWGYEFFKIDGMSGRNHSYCAHLYERPEIKACFKYPTVSNPFELCIRAFREGIGEDRIFLACQGHTSGPESLYADASRIGADIVHPNQPVKWSGVLNQARCFINQAFTHNIVMIADPDTLLVQDLSLEEARTSATIVALPGQLTFFGDKLANLSQERMKILQQTLPVTDVRPVNLYPCFHMYPLWNLRIAHPLLGSYNIVAFFNWEDEAGSVTVSPRELGIEATDYIGYEFWTKTPVVFHAAEEVISIPVPPHAVRLYTILPVKNIPQWIGSDRHITMNASELKEYIWLEKENTLQGKIELIQSFPLEVHFHIPEGYIFTRIIADRDLKYSVQQITTHHISILFQGSGSGEYEFKVLFNS